MLGRPAITRKDSIPPDSPNLSAFNTKGLELVTEKDRSPNLVTLNFIGIENCLLLSYSIPLEVTSKDFPTSVNKIVCKSTPSLKVAVG